MTTKTDEAAATAALAEASADAPAFERREGNTVNKLKRAIFSVPIEVVVAVGKARPLIGDLLALEKDHLLQLDSMLEDPVELRVNDRVIARGELTQSEDGRGRLGVRLTEVIDMSEILK